MNHTTLYCQRSFARLSQKACSPVIDLPGEGRIVLCKESVTNAWLNGLGKKAIDEGDGAGEEKPEEKPEEEKEDEEPDFLKKLREAYGDEVIDTLKAENDTSEWDNDEWVKQIWYYQNRKIINAMDPHTSLEDQLRSQYGNYKVDFIESSYDTTGWTTEDWLDALWERVDMTDDTAKGNSDVPDPYEDIYDDQYEDDPDYDFLNYED